MWENETARQTGSETLQPHTYQKIPPPPRPNEPDYLLRAQILVCVLLAVAVFCMRELGMPMFKTVQEEYDKAMSQEGSPAAQEVLEFAGDLLYGFQMRAQETLDRWSRQMDGGDSAVFTGAGGLFSVKGNNLPDGYSLKSCPLEGELTQPLSWYTVTSSYGWRKHPLTGKTDFHTGIDLANAEGTPIGSVRDGIVLKTDNNRSYGNYVQVLHNDGLMSVYCHMQYVFVRTGECVRAGQTLGTVGSTGVSTGPHLHFELVLDDVHYDPAAALGIE